MKNVEYRPIKSVVEGHYYMYRPMCIIVYCPTALIEQALGGALWERVAAGSGSLWGRPLLRSESAQL